MLSNNGGILTFYFVFDIEKLKVAPLFGWELTEISPPNLVTNF